MESRVVISDEILNELKDLRGRTGVGAGRLLKFAEGIPSGLNASMISNWLGGFSKSASREHLEFVLKCWRSLPQFEYVEISDRVRADLAELKRKSGKGPAALLAGRRHELPDGLSPKVIAGWISGSSRQARKDHVEYVLDLWKVAPDNPTAQERIQLTPSIRRKLERYKCETGIGPLKLLGLRKDGIPDGLISHDIPHWISGAAKTARKDHLEFVLMAWDNIARSGLSRVQITEKDIEFLRFHRLRTGVGPSRLVSGRPVPEGVTPLLISRILNKSLGSATDEQLKFLKETWSSLPDRQG